jgi:hypothetical protein
VKAEKNNKERGDESERETQRFRRQYEQNGKWVETVYSLSYVHPLYTLSSPTNVTNDYDFLKGIRIHT